MKWNKQGKVVVIKSIDDILKNGQDVMDFMMSIRYETGCEAIIAPKELFAEDFYDLRSGFAGEVLQKFVNYQTKLALTGDFTVYLDRSKSFRDFHRECNRGNCCFFTESTEKALEKLSELL